MVPPQPYPGEQGNFPAPPGYPAQPGHPQQPYPALPGYPVPQIQPYQEMRGQCNTTAVVMPVRVLQTIKTADVFFERPTRIDVPGHGLLKKHCVECCFDTTSKLWINSWGIFKAKRRQTLWRNRGSVSIPPSQALSKHKNCDKFVWSFGGLFGKTRCDVHVRRIQYRYK